MTTPPAPQHATRTINIEGATRAAIAMVVPLITVLALGMPQYAAFAMFAGFTAIFGAKEPYRQRAVTTGCAGALLAFCMFFGMAVSLAGAQLWFEAIGLAAVLLVAIMLLTTLRSIPAQPIFPVFAFVVAARVPLHLSDLPVAITVIVLSVLWAWLVAMSGSVLRRLLHRSPQLFGPLVLKNRSLAILRSPALWESVALNIGGALVAGAIAVIIPGLGHPYWAVVSLVATLPAVRQRHSVQRALNRVVGTIGGTVIAVGVLLLQPNDFWIVVVAFIGQFFAEIFVARHYAITLLFLTPLALTVSWLSVPEAPEFLAIDRIVQTVVGAAVSVLLLLLGRVIERRRGHPIGTTSSISTL